jgi:hypothetical protein
MPLWGTKSSNTQEVANAALESDPNNDPIASASQAAGTEWLAGHLNHLTEDQEKKLQEFKELCKENGYYKPGSETEEASHDDATMLYVLFSVVRWGLDGADRVCVGDFCARADSTWMALGASSRIPRIGAKRMPSKSCMRTLMWSPMTPPGGWLV